MSSIVLKASPIKQLRVSELTFGAYATGGEPLTAAQLGFATLPQVVLAFPKGGYTFEWSYATSSLIAYRAAAHSHTAFTVLESASAADKTAFVGIKDGAGGAVSGVSVGHAGGGTDAAVPTSTVAQAALAEVTNGVSLAGIGPVTIVAIGFNPA